MIHSSNSSLVVTGFSCVFRALTLYQNNFSNGLREESEKNNDDENKSFRILRLSLHNF